MSFSLSKGLAIIGHTLAGQIAGKATDEMQALVGVLDKVIARARADDAYGRGTVTQATEF